MPNLDIRFKARSLGVPLWKIAKEMNIGDNTLFRKLRKELTAEEKKKFFDVIQKIATDQARAGLEESKEE